MSSLREATTAEFKSAFESTFDVHEGALASTGDLSAFVARFGYIMQSHGGMPQTIQRTQCSTPTDEERLQVFVMAYPAYHHLCHNMQWKTKGLFGK